MRLQFEFDIIQPHDHVKMPAYVFLYEKYHNIQTFLEDRIGAEEPI
jgi:hypothetical protein